MYRRFLTARGTVGGILVGFKSSLFEVISWQASQYCAISIVKNIVDDFI
jgi:hypothetical protein